MANYNQQNQGGIPATVNGISGSWVPVDQSAVNFNVSADPNNPTQGPDGNFYYGGIASNNNMGFGAISANANNAIPTPSNIIQLPPIVQPVALVPFASQSQPLLQYDPAYRPPIETTANRQPLYRTKPYTGLSLLILVLLIIVVAASCLISTIKAGENTYTGLDGIMGALEVFGIGEGNEYYQDVLSADFADGIGGGFSDFMKGLAGFGVPILYLATMLFAVISVIVYLVRMAKKKSPRGFNIFTLLAFIFAVGAAVIMFLAEIVSPAIGAYVVAGILLVALIIPFFAKKNAHVLDYLANKQTYTM